jgi:hypothetical protein
MVGQNYEAQIQEKVRRVEINPVHEASISPFRKGDQKIEDALTRWYNQKVMGEPLIVRDLDTEEFLGLIAEGSTIKVGQPFHITMPPRSFSEIHAETKSRPRRIFQSFARR